MRHLNKLFLMCHKAHNYQNYPGDFFLARNTIKNQKTKQRKREIETKQHQMQKVYNSRAQCIKSSIDRTCNFALIGNFHGEVDVNCC